MNQYKEGRCIRAIYYCKHILFPPPPPSSSQNPLHSVVAMAAFYAWVKRGLYLSFSDYQMYQLPQEFWMKR